MNTDDTNLYIYKGITVVHIYEAFLIKLSKDKWITMTNCGLTEVRQRIDQYLTKG